MDMDSDYSDFDSDYDYPDPVVQCRYHRTEIKKYPEDVSWSSLTAPVNTNKNEVNIELKGSDDSQPSEKYISEVENENLTHTDITEENNHSDVELEKKLVSNFIIETDYPTSFSEIVQTSNNGKVRPRFFVDICNLLCGARCESVIPVLSDTSITLKEFLSISQEELDILGVLPFQKCLIKNALYKFHKYPYQPSSLHVVPLDDAYSNHDVAIQVLTLIKQVTSMEATFSYIQRNYTKEVQTESERIEVAKNIKGIKKKIRQSIRILDRLRIKAELWDKTVQPADLLTKYSKAHARFTPNRIILAAVLLTITYKIWTVLK